MGWFGRIAKKLTGILGPDSPAGGLLEAAMPWGKAIGFIGGMGMQYDAIQQERDRLKKLRKYGREGQQKAIDNEKYAVEDYQIDKGLLGRKFDLQADLKVDQLGTAVDRIDYAGGATNLVSGEVNAMKDDAMKMYGHQTDALALQYDVSNRALQKDLRKELGRYQTQYDMLGQYTNDMSYNFMEAYKNIV
tara:strand:+ start:33 stop:602 length:570 start_codon:yes stop_codon:yes gene_type:complete